MWGGHLRRVWKSQYPHYITMISHSANPMCFSHNIVKYSPDKEAGAVPWTFIWREGYGRISGGTRVLELAADSQEATPRKGARSTSNIAHEVEHTHLRGWSSTPTTRRTTAARGAARYGGADFRSAAAGKTLYGGFWLKFPNPAPSASEPRSDYPTQPLLLSVSCGVLGLSQRHTARIAPWQRKP
jgi:hypothetical protein